MAAADTPFIPPLHDRNATEEQRELLDTLGPGAELNLFRTLAHHPALMRSWMRFGGSLLYRGVIPGRDRELVILRSAARSGSDYEWGQHVDIARSAGLDDAEILACAAPVPGPPLQPSDVVLVSAVDDLVTDHRISPSTWGELSARYDDAAMIELTLLVGHYVMLAGMLNSVGVQTEGAKPEIGQVQ